MSAEIIEFSDRIVPGGVPVYVRHEVGEDAAPNECHLNVLRQVSEHGGSMVSGWMLFEVDDGSYTSMYHSVWRNGAGELVDVTPYRPQFQMPQGILFLVDPRGPFRGYVSGSHAMVPHVTDDDMTDHLLRCAAFDLMYLVIPERRNGGMARFLKQAMRLFSAKAKRCWCGSGGTARACCIPVLKQLAAPKRLMIRPASIDVIL